jgi:hypothetical protein
MLNVWCYIIFAIVALYGSFEAGRYYEGRIVLDLREEIATLKAGKITARYGPNYLHFIYRGQSYYVVNPKDENNPQKWIKTK